MVVTVFGIWKELALWVGITDKTGEAWFFAGNVHHVIVSELIMYEYRMSATYEKLVSTGGKCISTGKK